ncbi:hypothetical protein ACLM5J_11025 [Nocardioides sp. Bht2]|uniref:hypothetical protein n=1 Tax=Nocardioides sp. Bht2 TaxID=3392297 RepID=UPI0039B4940A
MTIPTQVFLSKDASSLGLTPHKLSVLLKTGALRRPFKGVYCPSATPDTIELRAQCAALVLPQHAVLCDRSAAWLHGVDCLRVFETVALPQLEVVAIQGAGRTRMTGIYGGERDLRPDEVMRIGGVPVTTPVRTAIDLACLRGAGLALAAVEGLMRMCGVTQSDLRRQLARHHGRRGVVQARRLVNVASPLSESPGESLTKWFLIEAGFPIPEQQIQVPLEGWGNCRLDLGYRELRIAIEYDGVLYHGDRQAKHDEGRRRALQEAGWVVIVVRKDDLMAGPAQTLWLEEVGMSFSERAPRFRRRFPPKTRSGAYN